MTRHWTSLVLLSLFLTGCNTLSPENATPLDKPALPTIQQPPLTNLNERSLQEILSDKKKASRLINDLIAEKTLSSRTSVQLLIIDGSLLMTGHVSPEEYQKLPDVIERLSNAYAITHFNNFTRTQATLDAQQDAKLTTKIRHKLNYEKQLNASSIIFLVDQQQVFLMGRIAPSQAETAKKTIENIPNLLGIHNLTRSTLT